MLRRRGVMKLPTRMRRRPESHRVLLINGGVLDFRATPAWSRPESNRDHGVFSAALSRVELRLRSGRGRIRTCDRAWPPGLRVPRRGPLGCASGVSRVGFEPTQVWLKARCPTVLGDRLKWAPPDLNGQLELPRIECLPTYTKGPEAFRRVRGSAGPAVPPPNGRRRYHWWPRTAARMPSRSQRTRRRPPPPP